MIKKLFRQMLLTQILSSMTVLLCLLIDSMVIGRFLGVDSMTAYGLAAPILLAFSALGSMISAGVQVLCGQTMGSGDREGVNACFTVSVAFAAVIAAVGLIVCLAFTGPVCTLLGAGEPVAGNDVFFHTRGYLRGFIIGAPAFLFAQIMVPFMQMSGQRIRLIAAVGLMTATDVACDLLSVFVFHGGMFGIGLASSVSYYAALAVGLAYLCRRSSIFRFRRSLLKWKTGLDLLRCGVPTMVNQLSLVLLTFVLNKLLLEVGQNVAVAAYSVISTVGNICYSFSGGIASVALMLASLLYMDEDKTGLRDLMRTMLFYALTVCAAVTLVVAAAAPWLVRVFLDNAAAEQMAGIGLRLFALSLVPCAVNTALKNYYQGVQHTGLTQSISVMQNFVFTALFAFVLSRFFSMTGIWLSFLCGEVLTALVVWLIVSVRNRKAAVTLDGYALLPPDFGVRDGDLFERQIRSAADVTAVAGQMTQFCQLHGRDPRQSAAIGRCLEELGADIMRHGFAGQDKDDCLIDVRLMLKPGETVLRIRDNGVDFDPVQYTQQHRQDPADSRRGIRTVMGMVKKARYVNSMGLNNLTLIL
ncbi:MAG: hypothetical protein IKI50_03700 [Clostridia bacterium]|nr:hypothetical protein [Clostridia bacterium]